MHSRVQVSLMCARSGSGDSYIHRYRVSTGTWEPWGKYLEGDDNNAYVNGLDYANGQLYTSWTIRETPDANTNHDVFFASYFPERDYWWDSNGDFMSAPLRPGDGLIWEVPQNSGMVNQEAQVVDDYGRAHILMRDNTTGTQLYQHYYLNPEEGIYEN
jgi:hypothetical protein